MPVESSKSKDFSLQYVNGPQKEKDPLKAKSNSLTARRELFERLSKTCTGFQRRDVVYACLNVILNVIRQDCASAFEAEKAYDEMIYHGKATLLGEHYGANGARRNVFPFDQHIVMPLVMRERE
jgi:hypothetical protein